jgi:hypothetical protein
MRRPTLYVACAALLFLLIASAYGIAVFKGRYELHIFVEALLQLLHTTSCFVIAFVLITNLWPNWLEPKDSASNKDDKS